MTNQLHPSWYQFKPGEQPSDLSLYDSLNMLFSHIDTMGVMLFASYGSNEIGWDELERAIHTAALQLQNMASEGQFLLDQWDQAKKPAVRQVQGGES